MRRNERFSTIFQERIESLLQVLIQYVLSKYKEMPLETQELNKSLAHFLKVCSLSPSIVCLFNSFVSNSLEMFEHHGPRFCI